MLKILSATQIREADACTIANEPISSVELMERAAQKCHDWLQQKFTKQYEFLVFCGKGNNGGDGLAIARMLLANNYQVKVVLLAPQNELSVDCRKNYDQMAARYSTALLEFTEISKLNPLKKNTIILDAIFGTGLSKPIEGQNLAVIEWINSSAAIVVSIDIPSGMFADLNAISTQTPCVRADYTLTFQFPKFSFLFPQSGNSVGEMIVLDIGLDASFIQNATTSYFYTEQGDCENLLHKRSPFSHKGNFGHALIVAGSEGKVGAAVLSTHACLRSGAGLVSTLLPTAEKNVLQASLPEAMLFSGEDFDKPTALAKFSSIGIGPGIGLSEAAAKRVKHLIQNYPAPIVFDADAITILAENKTWLGFLSKYTVFTPHLKELERLVGKAENDFHRLELAKSFATKYATHLIIKGKYSCIVCPDGNCYFNSTGNAGMAKGGSGDVLTGILTSLLAQGYPVKEACILGVYIHGKAGDIAASLFSETAMIAGDIIDCLPETFKQLSRKDT